MLGEEIAPRLLRLIREQAIGPGERLPSEPSLCQLLGVSRPALREALSALEALGVVAARKGSGRVIQRMSFGTLMRRLGGVIGLGETRILDLLTVRQVLEINMLPVAMPRISPASFAELEVIVAAMERRAHAGSPFYEEDEQFHRLLYRDLGNEALMGVLELFWSIYALIDPRKLTHSERLEETAGHHRRILEALKAGDLRKAQYHLDTHFYDIGWSLAQGEGGAAQAPMVRMAG